MLGDKPGLRADPDTERLALFDAVTQLLIAASNQAPVLLVLDDLPDAQRQVVLLRDLEGLPAAEVAALLGITDANQRVLLHRGRANLRRLLATEVVSS